MPESIVLLLTEASTIASMADWGAFGLISLTLASTSALIAAMSSLAFLIPASSDSRVLIWDGLGVPPFSLMSASSWAFASARDCWGLGGGGSWFWWISTISLPANLLIDWLRPPNSLASLLNFTFGSTTVTFASRKRLGSGEYGSSGAESFWRLRASMSSLIACWNFSAKSGFWICCCATSSSLRAAALSSGLIFGSLLILARSLSIRVWVSVTSAAGSPTR